MPDQQQNTLKWGDIIRIHGVNLNKNEQEQSKGLIVSKGFTDSNIYYQKYTEFENVNFYRESLFQIMPISNFEIHDQLSNPKNLKSPDRDSLKKKAEGEIESLYRNLKNKRGTNVRYGSEAIFRHVESNSYLRGLQKAADTGEGAFMIEVNPMPSSQVIWKINSHRSYQHDGDEIFFDDQLLIYHVSTDCFMNFVCSDQVIYLDSEIKNERVPKQGDIGWEYYKSRPSIKRANQPIRNSIINENKSKCLWKFIEHCKAEQYYNKEKIKSHDIVYFEHTRNKGCISSSLSGDKYYLKETIDQKQSFESFWELIPKETKQLEPEQCNDFFARNIVTGNYLTYNDFKVRIISKEEVEGGGFLSHGLVNLICSQSGENCEGRKLQRGNLIPKDPNTPKTLKFAEDLYDLYELKDVEELTEDSFFIMKVDDQTIMNIQYILSSHEHLVKFLRGLSSYMLKERQRMGDKLLSSEKMSENKQGQNLQAESKKQIVQNILQYQDTAIEELQNMRSILQLLAGKIYGTLYSEIVSSGNTPNPTIQKILVDTGTTELLIEIIFQLYEGFKHIETNPDATMDRVRKMRISDVFERVYRLLEKIVVGNSKNKFYLSRWVDLFLEHSKNINRQYIQQCLVGILQNNPQAIEATINQQKIIDLIQRFYVEADRKGAAELTTKYLRLFSTFIKCEDRILKENQNIILEHFFKDKKNIFCYRFKVETKEDEAENPQDPFSKIKTKRVEIALDKQDFCPIPKYFKDWGPKWNYFLQFVNLLADVCMDKNNNAIENVSALVTFQIVAIILYDPEIKSLNDAIAQANKAAGQVKYPVTNVHQPFVRIAHYVYIYNSKFTTIKTIKNISRWYRHQGEEKGIVRKEDINQTKRAFEGQKEQEEKFYITAILLYIENFIEECTQDEFNLSILHTVLLLFKETVLLGLWESITRFRKLIPLLIMRIIKIQDKKLFNIYTDKKTAQEVVQSNKEGLSFNRPENLLNINCKTKATDIFRLMNELQIDIRLRYMMNFFKGLYEATENFDDYNKQDEEEQIPDQDVRTRNQSAKEEFNKNEISAILGEVRKISEDQDIMQKVNIWCNKFKELTPFDHNPRHLDNMSKNRYLFQGGGDKQVPSFQSMVLALFELPVYKSDKLLSSSLTMLRMMFEQRKDLIEQFKGILVCGKGNLMEVYMTLKYMREKFDMLTNQNVLRIQHPRDTEFSYFIDQSYDAMEKNPAKRSGILQDLFFLSRTLKEDINLKNIEALMVVEDGIFDDNSVYNYLSEKERNNKLFQDMNIAQGIYLPLTSYIKLVGDRPFNKIHRKILFSIYHYLALLCFNNLQGKQKLMQYVLDAIPHLKRRVGAANFLYQVTLNNKNLIANTGLVAKIIDGALQACIELDKEDPAYEANKDDKEFVAYNSYEKSQIIFALRGILLLNNEGFRLNQEKLMSRFQDNRFKRLIYKNKIEFINKRDSFSLTPHESYVACFFELFSIVVESKNFINVGKLENIHPYTYCLECLKNTNRWQIRRSIRAYINRLFYVNKDRDIFLFQQFVRKQFKIINDELQDLILLYRNKNINDEITIPNGIRFKYAMSEVIETILEIFITIEEMLLKPEFLKILKRQIEKEEKKPENQREIHDQFVKLLYSIGCLNKLYPTKNIINSFIREVRRHIEKVMMWFDVKFLEKQARQDNEAPAAEENDDLGVDQEKKNYIYDHSKSFFRNLSCMIRDIKAKDKKEEMKREALKRERKDGTPEELKQIYIKTIFNVEGENLKPIVSKKYREVSTSLYKPHIQTANSRIFKLIAKPTLTENEENIELNRRLGIVKDIIDDSPVFRKLRENEFYKLVTTLTNINQTSKLYYSQRWLNVGQKSQAVMTLKQIFTKSFRLIMNNHESISDSQKIFVIKIARCYITEAVESKQNYKLPVDKWDADYFPGKISMEEPGFQERSSLQKELLDKLTERQILIMECGGSEFIESIFKFYNTFSNRLEILNETLLLGIAYLFGGNTDCQNNLLEVLTADRQNSMMLSIKRLISNIGLILIEMRKIKDQAVSKDRDFAYSIVDTYDFFQSKDNIIQSAFGMTGFDKSEMRNEKYNQLALCRIFRYLQLFCENGNIKMKNFLLAQSNDLEGTQKKTNSINFIETTSLLLRKLFKVMNNKIVGIPATLLDFINQITQLPCIDNQKAFMKSTFFEDLSYLADYFVGQQNLVARKFTVIAETDADDQPITQLKAIYQKGIELALCNFQGNDNELILEFISKCQPKFLWIVIKQNLSVILRERAEILQVVKEQSKGQLDYDRALLSKFNKEAITQFIDETMAEQPMFREQLLNILSVFYILKKVKLYQDNCYAIAFEDKNKPNFQQKKKGEKAEFFLADMVTYAKSDGYEFIKKFLELFDQLILSIQISSHNGNQQGFQYIYFPKHPIFNELSNETRNDIMMRVKRQTQRDKLITLLKLQGEVYQEINLNYTLKYVPHNIPFVKEGVNFPITAQYGSKIRSYARNLSFMICFLMLFFIVVDHDTEEMTSTFTYTNRFSAFFIRVLAAFQLLVTAWFMVIWISLRKPLALKKYDIQVEERRRLQANAKGQVSEDKKKMDESEVQGWDLLMGHYQNLLNSVRPYTNQIKDTIMSNPIVRNVFVTAYALANYEAGFLSILMFVVAAIMGNFVGVEWYTIHLFDIFTEISELTNIFKAILNNFKKLALLSFLAGVFILVFNVISLNTYTSVLWQDDLPEEACQDIVGCVLSLFTGGAIGESMDEFDFMRFLFDTVYVVFMEIMFQSIVGGIMIDAFSELKDQDSARDEDKSSFCYICGMTKPDMEKSGTTFEKHISKHFLWNYLYYLYILKEKDKTDYTGLQFDIDQKVSRQDVDWFPAMGEGDAEGEVEKVIEGLQGEMNSVFAIMDDSVGKTKQTLEDAIKVTNKIKEKEA